MAEDPYSLPPNLPVPVDDGACDHLPGAQVPSIPRVSTRGGVVDLSRRPGWAVVYCYPRMGRPGEPLLPGWDAIPGARGCTVQSCAFRDRFLDLRDRGVEVFGLSTQAPEEQREAVVRLGLPFELLSDFDLAFTRALHLPTFQIGSATFIKRLTLVLRGGRIAKVFYPVFPPQNNVEDVLRWLAGSGRTP